MQRDKMSTDLNTQNIMEAELPYYEPPPPWIPPEQRRGHPYYDNDLERFLPRITNLHRNRNNDALGFNIRGGQEHSCGIFISKVLPNTEAQRLGLQEGDQILTVNGTPFDDTDHSLAVRILKQNTDVQLTVQYFPYAYQKTYEKIRPVLTQPR